MEKTPPPDSLVRRRIREGARLQRTEATSNVLRGTYRLGGEPTPEEARQMLSEARERLGIKEVVRGPEPAEEVPGPDSDEWDH